MEDIKAIYPALLDKCDVTIVLLRLSASYLFWAVFTIVSTSWTISLSLASSLLLAASTKQHERCPSKSWRLLDLTSQMTAKFCWMTEIQYLSCSIIVITLSRVLLAFLSEMSVLSLFFFIRLGLAIRIGLCTYGVGIMEIWENAREFLLPPFGHLSNFWRNLSNFDSF